MIVVKKVTHGLLLVAAIFSIVSCQAWKYYEASEVIPHKNEFEVLVPAGWVQYLAEKNRGVVITKDGPSLQLIRARSATFDEAVQNIDFELNEDILPSDLARFYEAKFKSDNTLFSIEKSSNQIRVIDGRDGFEIELDYKNERGLRYRTVVSGFVDDENFYEISYTAPILYQFDLNIATYNDFVDSFSKI